MSAENVIPAPQWLVERMEILKSAPPPDLDRAIMQMEASNNFIKEEAARLALPTKDKAKAILLESALGAALHTIEFLHGCLTSDGYKYAYPDQTVQRIDDIKTTLAVTAILPETQGCPHSMHRTDCEACVTSMERHRLIRQADAVLRGSYDVESAQVQADERAAPASDGNPEPSAGTDQDHAQP